MGVHCYLIQITEAKLMNLDENDVPSLFHRASQSRISDSVQLGVFQDPGTAGEPIPALWLEKKWWRLSQFLTSSQADSPDQVDLASPLSRSLLGGRPIGRDLQRGPARYFWAEEVAEISLALSSQTHHDLLTRYQDTAALIDQTQGMTTKSRFPDERIDDDARAEILSTFDLLAGYYAIATIRGNAMLLGLT